MIGPDWLTVEQEGRRRLDDPDDWVRREIAAALGKAGVSVIPVLVGGAVLPSAADLPEALEALPGRQAVSIRPERFEDDVEHLIDEIGGVRRSWHGFPLWGWLAAAGVVFCALVVAFVVRSNRPPVVDAPSLTAISGVPLPIDLRATVDDEDPEGLRFGVPNRSVAGGGLVEEGEGLVTYQAADRFTGPDSFEFTVTDGDGATSRGSVNIDVSLGQIGGRYNVAVAEFASPDPATASLVSEGLYEEVQEALAVLDIDGIAVAGPEEIGAVDGETPEERAVAAEELARRTGADVVIYGSIDSEGGISRVSSEFFVSRRSLGDVEELSGGYPLVDQTVPGGSAAVATRTGELLVPKVRALTGLAVGLSHYQLREWAEAREIFEQTAADWPGGGDEVVYFLVGNVRGLTGDIEGAAAAYRQALEFDPGYARAKFGIAEVQYQRARSRNCLPAEPVDVEGLDGAIAGFEEAAALPAPELAYLPERASIEIARILLCKATSGSGNLAEVKATIEAVLPDLEDDPLKWDLAAEAHATLAAYHTAAGDHQASAEEFDAAAGVTLDPARRLMFLRSAEFTYRCLLDDVDRADSRLAEAQRSSEGPLGPVGCS